MKSKCIVCNNEIIPCHKGCYCNKCGTRYDTEMNFIPSRHNWNLFDFSKSLAKDSELSYLKHQS